MSAAAAALCTVGCGGGDGSTAPVSVAQVVITSPASPATIGTFGRTVTFVAEARNAAGAAIAGATPTWSTSDVAVATVSATGVVTATGNGTAQIRAASGGRESAPVAVTVLQVAATIAVISTSATPDTLRTTGRTRQYSAAVRDSNGNAIAGASVSWSSDATSVATVGAAGMVTAVGDGSATIAATSGGAQGTRAVVVRRFAASFAHTPASASITTSGGTAVFTAAAQDSAGTALTISWASRNATLFTASPVVGTGTTATAVGNGSAYLVMSAGTRSDSALVTVSGQVAVSFASSIEPIFTTSCAGCHDGSSSGTLPSGMNLRSGFAFGAIVGVASIQVPTLARVSPGSVLNSYLARKIDPMVGAISGSPMPVGDSLTAQQIQLIKTWIAQGALNN